MEARDHSFTVGIDVGTTAVKALAVSDEGDVLSTARIPHRFPPRPANLEHDVSESWRDAPKRALGKIVQRLGKPAAVSVAAMAPAMAAVDLEGKGISPGLLYGDARLSRAGDMDPRDPTKSGETVGMLEWLARTAPAASGYWHTQAVANFALCGKSMVDIATALTSGQLLHDGKWSEDRCRSLRVEPQKLPAIGSMGEAVEETDGVVVGLGSVDALCEQIVAGPLGAGDALIGCGSTLVVWHIVEGCPTFNGLWTVPHLVPGLSLVGGPSNAGGLFLDWTRRLVGDHRSRAEPTGTVPLWLPYLRGERVPLHRHDAKAALVGADPSTGPSAVRRAAFEASAFSARRVLELSGWRNGSGQVVITGGGVRSQDWCQAMADVLLSPLAPVAVPEGGALGAAWFARMAVGLEVSMDDAARWARSGPDVVPRLDAVEAVGERWKRWKEAARLPLAGEPR